MAFDSRSLSAIRRATIWLVSIREDYHERTGEYLSPLETRLKPKPCDSAFVLLKMNGPSVQAPITWQT